MPIMFIRRTLWGLGAIVFAIALGSLVLSAIAGRQLVQSSLVQELSALTGRPVAIEGAVTIRVFPTLEAELKNVSIRDWQSNDDEPALFEAETITLGLSPRAAIRGKVNIQSMTLQQPRLNLPAGDRSSIWQGSGRIGAAFRRAQGSLSNNPDELAFVASRGQSFGRLTIESGSVVKLGESQALLSSLDGYLSWNASTDAMALSGTGIWNGEAISINGRIGDMIHLAAGRTTTVEMNVQSKPVQTSFQGTATLKPSLYLDGLAGMEFPSGRQLEVWLGTDFPLGDLGGPFKTSGTIKGDLNRWTFNDAAFSLEETEGRGNLTFVTEKERRKLSGTFDLDAFNMADFAQIMMPLEFKAPPIGVQPAIALTADTKQSAMDIDLRVSAERAFANGFVLTDIAATAQRSGNFSAFDINNAEIFGGIVQFAMRVSNKDNGQAPQTELRILAENIDGTQFAQSNVAFAGFPRATTTLSAILRGEGDQFQSVFDSANGSISFRTGQGTMNGLSLSTFVKNLRSGRFFELKDRVQKESGQFSFNNLDAKGVFDNGSIRFENIAVGLDRANIKLDGLASLSNQSLAMSGTVTLDDNHPLYVKPQIIKPETDIKKEVIRFFIGGDYHQAFVSPMPARPIGN